MSLSDLRAAPHLSASSIGDYLDCGLLFKFGRIDKIKQEMKADALEFGSTIHLVLAEIYQQKMVGICMTIKEIHESFEKHWTRIAKDRDDIQYAEGKSFETLLLEGKELLTTYYHKRPDDKFQVVAIEEPFSFILDGCNIPIIGAMDLVEEDSSGILIITDFKTSGRSYSRDEVDRNFQLTLYQIAAKAIGYTDREILLRFDCLIKTKTPKFEQYYTTRSETDEIRATRKIVEVAKGISKGVFIPNDSPQNWKCKGCSFKKPCDDWFMKEAA
ncbi:MAG: PD-(D/E)XK nuclease family protein [Syntrophales bacterium]